MVLPLIAGAVAAIGIGTQVFGAASASDAAKREAAAMRKGSQEQQKLTKKQNKVYNKQAKAQSKAARRAADVQTASAEESNAIRDDVVADINASRQQMVDAQNAQADASIAAETSRFQQMKLDATRERRSVMRNALIARSVALAGATASGASGGSGLQGGYAQIAAQRTGLLLGIFQNEDIGSAIFEANKAYTEAGSLVNQYQADIETRRNLGEAELANVAADRDASLARLTAQYQDKNAKLQKQSNKIATQKAGVESRQNIQVGNARSDQVTAQGIQSVGSSLTSAGIGLF